LSIYTVVSSSSFPAGSKSMRNLSSLRCRRRRAEVHWHDPSRRFERRTEPLELKI
jgi:hypothetical protein